MRCAGSKGWRPGDFRFLVIWMLAGVLEVGLLISVKSLGEDRVSGIFCVYSYLEVRFSHNICRFYGYVCPRFGCGLSVFRYVGLKPNIFFAIGGAGFCGGFENVGYKFWFTVGFSILRDGCS